MPAATFIVMRLVLVVRGSSSLKATNVRLVREFPVNRVSIVSKSLPVVVSVRPPSRGAVQVHQTDFSPSSEESGSPGSSVAPALLPPAVTFVPTRTKRVAKLSLSGSVPWLRRTKPATPSISTIGIFERRHIGKSDLFLHLHPVAGDDRADLSGNRHRHPDQRH